MVDRGLMGNADSQETIKCYTKDDSEEFFPVFHDSISVGSRGAFLLLIIADCTHLMKCTHFCMGQQF